MSIKKIIPVNEPLLNGNEKKYLSECIDSGWISSEGPFVSKFEEDFAGRVDRKYGIAVCNGTAAIDIAIDALSLNPGDEVIMPTFTIISCINQIIRAGLIPRLVDSDPITWNMNVKQIEEKISERTTAILVPHIYGLPVDMDPIIELANKYKLFIIEDAAEMHGQTYKGRKCGSFGDISTFSFYPNKHITTGEGGMVVTNNKDIADICKGLRNLCFQADNRFVHERLGWNMRMTNLQAAVGVAQLERLDEFVSRKREMGKLYSKLLHGLPGVQLPLPEDNHSQNIYWVYGLVLQDTKFNDAKEVIIKLGELGVGCRPFFYPMHQQPILRKMGFFHNENYPIAENLYKNGLYLPSGMALSKDQIEYVAEKVWEILG